MILLYEYASNGSLDRHLSNTSLTWSQRIKISLDAARGLCYLHDANRTHQRVLHRDIKSANILLDDKWKAKVSDMGLSKIGPANLNYSYMFTNVVGTPGYCDPQYMKTYTLTKESHIYSFGVVLFEVLCGRLCYDTTNGQLKVLVPMWIHRYRDKKLADIIFHGLTKPMDSNSLEAFSDIAFQCLHESREERPPMSLIVEKLEIALKFQEPRDLKVPKGKPWFSLNDKGHHRVLISIDQCLDSYSKDKEDYTSRYSLDYNSRFQVGTYNTHAKSFNTCVRCEFLSPGITYMMNLVFKSPDLFTKNHTRGKQEYIAIPYILNLEKRFAIVHIGDKRKDEWLVAEPYQFTTTNNESNDTIEEFQIEFLSHKYLAGGLEIEGIEFQPHENLYELEHDDQVQLDQYQEILTFASPLLIYRSIKELKLLLSRGVLLNGGIKWFYLNDKGQHCKMISIKECLILDATKRFYHYTSDYNSRFPSGSLREYTFESRTRVRPQFLSPYITYTVNLVFRFCKDAYKEESQINLKYKLDGETKTWISYLIHRREDNWWMVELFQFTSYATIDDLKIIFECKQGSIEVEGIEFQPLENDEYQLLENKEDMQQVSHSDFDDSYWEQKLPNDYKDIIKLSKDDVQWTTKKELYSILCRGFLINNGEEWFFLDKNGKRCQMLSAKATFGKDKIGYIKIQDWQSLPDSRFEEVFVVRHYTIGDRYPFDSYRHGGNSERLNPLPLNKIKYQGLSTGTIYTCYLVFKLLENQSYVKAPVKVRYSGSKNRNDCWYLYLVSHQTQVIVSGKVDANTRSTLNKSKRNSFPQERSDGWMEIKVCEFQTDTSIGVIPSLILERESLIGVRIQGIELRST